MAKCKTVDGIRVRYLPPLDEILDHFEYDERDGRLLHAQHTSNPWYDAEEWNREWAGTPAECKGSAGYLRVNMGGKSYPAHRIIWKIKTGKDPNGLIDHINGVRDDNRFENLRDVSQAQNMGNCIRGRFFAEQNRKKIARDAWIEFEKEQHRARIEASDRKALMKLLRKYGIPHEYKKDQETSEENESALTAIPAISNNTRAHS